MKDPIYYNASGCYDPTAGTVLAACNKKERSDRRKAIRKQNRQARTFNRRIIYICSPYAGDTVRNILAAQRYCKYAVSCGYIPFAPHLLFPQFLDDGEPKERALGLSFGNVFMDIAKELWIFGDRLSAGMQAEYDRALRKGYKIRRFTKDCIEITENGKDGDADGDHR